MVFFRICRQWAPLVINLPSNLLTNWTFMVFSSKAVKCGYWEANEFYFVDEIQPIIIFPR